MPGEVDGPFPGRLRRTLRYTLYGVVAVGVPGGGRRPLLPTGTTGPCIMGLIRAAPDSFWEGSGHKQARDAAATARAMVDAGAEVLGIRVASPRPGAPGLPLAVEIGRLLAILTAVRDAVRCPISVDTSRSEVAIAALEAGADAVNDASGLTDNRLADVIAHAQASLILRAEERLDATAPVAQALIAAWEALVARALAAGIPTDRLVVDPGFGFGKTPEQNIALVAALPCLRQRLGLPICIEPSRTGIIARVRGPRRRAERHTGSAALVALCAAYGADMICVHDVAEMAEAAAVAASVGPPCGSVATGISAYGPEAGQGTICVRGIRVEACHGVLAAEHSRPQPFLVDLDLHWDLSVASHSDCLGATLDYAAAAAVVEAVLRGPRRNLLERLAGDIADRLLATFLTLRSGVVIVHKPEAPLGIPFDDVSVRLPFGRVGGRRR